MSSNYSEGSLRRHWFWIALAIAIFFGYTFGKDRALRDNHVDGQATVETTAAP